MHWGCASADSMLLPSDNLQSWGGGSMFVQEWLNAWCKFRDMLATHRGGQEVDVISVWRGREGFLEVVAVR